MGKDKLIFFESGRFQPHYITKSEDKLEVQAHNLIVAVCKGDSKKVEALINENVNVVNCVVTYIYDDPEGFDTICFDNTFKDETFALSEAVSCACNRKYEEDKKEEDKKEYIKIASMLIDAGAYFNWHDGRILAEAICTESIELVDKLLKKGAKVNSAALCYATIRGDYELVNKLIDAGANVNETSQIFGYYRDCPEHKVEILLKARYSSEKYSYGGKKKLDANDKFHEKFWLCDALSIAVFMGHEKIVDRIIKSGVDVNINNWKALQCAVNIKNIKFIKKLLLAGANADVVLEIVEQNKDLKTSDFKNVVEKLIAEVNIIKKIEKNKLLTNKLLLKKVENIEKIKNINKPSHPFNYVENLVFQSAECIPVQNQELAINKNLNHRVLGE